MPKDMNEFTDRLSEELQCSYTLESSRYWNGHAYFPLDIYRWQLQEGDSNVCIEYECRDNEYAKPNSMDGGAFGARHLFKISCRFPSPTAIDFRITEPGLLAKWLKGKKQKFHLKCQDSALTKELNKNESLDKIFSHVLESPEFSPSIEASTKNQICRLVAQFNLQQTSALGLMLILEFFQDIRGWKKA